MISAGSPRLTYAAVRTPARPVAVLARNRPAVARIDRNRPAVARIARNRPAVRLSAIPSKPLTVDGFTTRFRAQLAGVRVRFLAACVVTAVAPALAAMAFARSTAAAGPDRPETEPAVITQHSQPSAGAAPETPGGEPPPGPPPASVAVALPVAGDPESWAETARQVAATCPGLPPEVLIAISQVESRFGQQRGPSRAGALGPMQFMPSTWSQYGTDGDGDGSADVMNPLDAMKGAAAMLCANGAADPERLRTALWNYNHSDEYVDAVLRGAGLTR